VTEQQAVGMVATSKVDARAGATWEQAVGTAGRHWGLHLFNGTVMVLIGIATLVWPGASLLVVSWLFAVTLLVNGIVQVLRSVADTDAGGGRRVLFGLLGALSLLAGVLCLRSPLQTLAAIALLIGSWWIVSELLDAEPDSVDLVTVLSRRFAPPVLWNTEGEPLVLCEVTLRTGDPAALVAELDETYERDDTGTPQWFDRVMADGMEPIRATLRLDGHDLTVHTNSEARLDRVLDTLRKLDPTLTVVDESRQPTRDTREATALAAGSPSGAVEPLDPADPEVTAVIEGFVRDYERKWLDEPIPALAGHTPREAASDPTRRDDLIRLLDSFPAHRDDPGLMNPDRLRAALDLR
jgi:hypothetical protein